MSLVNGVTIGVVTKVKDGQVKVKYPWLHENDGEEKESDWIRIAAGMAGNGRGIFFMPEIEDEVLVAFEQGSFNHPFIVGFLWNGKDKAPETDTQKRVIKTKSGHIVEFDDNKGVEKITIKTQGNHQIVLDDTPPGKINIKSNKNHQIELNDSPPGKITIKSIGNQKIEIDDMIPGSITISTNKPGSSININTITGMVNVDCLTATIKAKAIMKVEAPLTIFDGIVQTKLLQSKTVVSEAFNFMVPGNIFGL